MRWLLGKDLLVLKRSPLLVALLVLYPLLLALLLGLALSRGPEKPRVAFFNQVPSNAEEISVGGDSFDASKYADEFFKSIDPVRVSSREEAFAKVRSGDVLGALIVPPDITTKLEGGVESPTVEVFYNAEDPVKARYVQDTIKSRVQDANLALTRRFTDTALEYLDLIATGGRFSFLGRDFNVLGLQRSEEVLRAARRRLPASSPLRLELDKVIGFTRLARENLDLSDEVLGIVGAPIRVKTTVVRGGGTPLTTFAVAVVTTLSLMLVSLLLAAGALAHEREENAFRRLVRSLVRPEALLAEKILLGALVGTLLALLLLAGLALFVDLDAGRAPWWVVALVPAATAFAAAGVAVGAAAREVRAASLVAIMVGLPLALLALVPSGAVSGTLYDLTRAVSAVFPFRPALAALEAALRDGGEGLAGPVAHLLGLTLGFGVLARIALKRFA